MIPGSPNLEVISNPSTDVETEVLERRRLPRLNLSTEQFRINFGKIFSVNDLSETGMSLRILDQQDFLQFTVAAKVEGTLNLHGAKFSAEARVVRLGVNEVGFEFLNLAADISSAIHSFLDPSRLGSELKPIPSSENGPLWYHGPSGTDLLLWRGADGQYHRIVLFVLGSYIQWNVTDGLETGRSEVSQEAPETWGVVRFETMLLHSDAAPDSGKLSIAKKLLVSSNLPQDLKKWCLRQLET